MVRIRNRRAGEASPWGHHRSKNVPRIGGEVEAENGGGSGGAVKGIRTSIEDGPTKDVKMGSKRNSGKIAEAIDVRVWRERRQSAPSQVFRVEEVRRCYGRVLREDAYEVRTAMAVTRVETEVNHGA